MRDIPHARVDKPNNTDKHRVMFTIAHTVLISDSKEAERVAELVNLAYERGRSDIQRDLRWLINAARDED